MPENDFLEYIKRKKNDYETKIKIIQKTTFFLENNQKKQFILYDVAKYFDIPLIEARSLVSVWFKFGLVDTIPSKKLPKSFKITKTVNKNSEQLNKNQ